jgi:DnaJ-class molecular chaperone
VTDPRVPETLHPSGVCPECNGEGKLYAPERLGEEGIRMHDLVYLCGSCGGTGERKAR